MNHRYKLNPSQYEAVEAGERYFIVMPAHSSIQKGDALNLVESDFSLHNPSGREIECQVTHISAEKQLDHVIVGFLPYENQADRLEAHINAKQ